MSEMADVTLVNTTKSPCGKSCELVIQGGYPIVGHYRDDRAPMVRCTQCGYMAFDPMPTEEMLNAFYSGEYWEPEQSAGEAQRVYENGDFSGTVAAIREAWRAVGGAANELKVHDIGCGYGGVVYALNRDGVAATGSDLSITAIAAANASGNQNVFRRTLDEHLASSEAVGVNMFFMSHSLEHMPEPRGILRTLRDSLPDEGISLIRVPNGAYVAALLARYIDYTWFQYPAHIHYFTPASIYCLFEAAGLRVMDIRTLVREDHERQLWGKLFGAAPEQLPDGHALLEALAKNGMAMELQVIACRDDSSLAGQTCFSGGLSRNAVAELPAIERDIRNVTVVTQSQAEFVTGGQAADSTRWRYSYSNPDGSIHYPSWDARQTCWIAHDGSRLHSNFIYVSPDIQYRLTKRVRLPLNMAGMVRVSVEGGLTSRSGMARYTIYRNDEVLDTVVFRDGGRALFTRYVRVLDGDEVTVGFEVRDADWPVLYYGVAIEPVNAH